ncbi:DUF1868 domain-containing protein [Tritonibacter horizontis]|uniref:DUF1868 domain-containing protein n=1 Tax=Tritonibacter horizontis TaxID=1768241 RepID=A0A132BVA7_9RHOB|nr:DUF1868 domain-containing protein [Tritonibacter horizontis]KUP91982.1 hypothetical protein TRIHO_31650 [Tritonibacter horizontis]
MAIFRPDPMRFLTGTSSDTARPGAITEPGQGGKFTPVGEVLPFPGNTILCHIDPTSDAHAALCEMQDDLRQSDFGALFTYLPAASLHMTVFQGISPDERNWPEGLPQDASRDEVTAAFVDRLSGQDLPERRSVAARGLYAGHSVTLDGVDAIEEARLRTTRMSLRDLTGLRHDHFDTYTFHSTLGYLLRWLDASEATDLIAFSDETFARYADRLARIELGPLELCNFETMHYFEPVALLSRRAAF